MIIQAEGLTRTFRKAGVTTEVLRGASVAVAPGEYVAIMGPSGSGKSTLMNILGFLDRPDSGTYRFQGEDLSGADDDRLSAVRNKSIGFVFQQFHLLDRASALQNVNLPLLYAEGDVGDVEARGRAALAAVGLSHREAHLPGELSGGEQQRVAVARALVNDPAVVLADEPTGNLDAKNADEVLALFAALHQKGRTLVVITHDQEVAARAGRVLELREGRIVGERSTGASTGRPRPPSPSTAEGTRPTPP